MWDWLIAFSDSSAANSFLVSWASVTPAGVSGTSAPSLRLVTIGNPAGGRNRRVHRYRPKRMIPILFYNRCCKPHSRPMKICKSFIFKVLKKSLLDNGDSRCIMRAKEEGLGLRQSPARSLTTAYSHRRVLSPLRRRIGNTAPPRKNCKTNPTSPFF